MQNEPETVVDPPSGQIGSHPGPAKPCWNFKFVTICIPRDSAAEFRRRKCFPRALSGNEILPWQKFKRKIFF